MASAYDLVGGSSSSVNGQLVPRVRVGNYFPRPLSATGPGGGGVPAYPPQSSAPSSPMGGGSGSASVATAAANPWSPVHSPVPWLIGFFVAGVLLLRFVHHGY